MGKRGVFNIINNRTGKVYTASSDKDIDKLMAIYRSNLKKRNHHNSELNRDARNGDTFRIQVVSRNCKSEKEVRSLRDAQIRKNRNKYNKTDNVSFEGGNSNSKYYGRKNRRLENSRRSSYYNSKKRNKSYSKNPRYYGDGTSTIKYFPFKPNSDSLTEKQKKVMKKHFEAIKSQNSKKSQPPKKHIRKSKYYNKNKTKQPEGHLKNPRYYGKNRKPKTPVTEVINISGGENYWIKCPNCGTLNHILWIKDNEKCYKCSNEIKFKDIISLKKEVPYEKVSDYNDKKLYNGKNNLKNEKIKIPIISVDEKSKKENKAKKICPNCKKEIDSSDKFCINCGTKLIKSSLKRT